MRMEFDDIQGELMTHRWIFWVKDATITVDVFIILGRESKRHKLKMVGRYNRIMHRDSSIKEAEVPLTNYIKDKAKELFINQLTVTL